MTLGPGAVDLSTQGTVRVATSVATIVSQIDASLAGDTVEIAAGSYGYVTTTKSIATGFIRIVPAVGATVTIAGVDMSGAQGLDWRGINTTGNSTDNVWWQGSSRCRWRGGTHTIAATANCFTVRQSTSDIIVEDVTVNGALCSFYVQAFDEATRPTNITFSRFRSTSVAQDHVFLSRGDTIVVEDFEMFGHTESDEHQDGVQMVGPKGVTIRRGHIWNTRAFRNGASDQNDHGIIANYDPAETPNGRVPENITVENVLIHDMTSHGITVAGVLGMTISHCTIYDNGPTGTASALSVAPDPGNTISGLVITNNILSKVAVSGVTPTTNSHNFVADGSGPTGTSLLSGAPGFVDSATQDYALTEASQNLVSGSATYGTSTDMNGTTRPSPPSRGALELAEVGGGTSGPPVIRSVSALGAQANWPDLILDKPAGTVEGDDLVAIQFVTGVGAGTPASVTAPAGFVQTGATQQITDAGIGKVWRKRAGSSEPATYTFGGDNRDGLAVIMLAVEAGTFDPTTPLNVTPVWGGAASPASAQPAPTATTTADNTLLVAAWASRTFNNAASYTPPAGMTEIADTNPAWNYITAAAATELRAADGATGTRTATCTRSSNYLSVTLALAPAAATAVTGTVAAISPVATASAAATVRATAAVAGVAPAPTGTLAAVSRLAGVLAAGGLLPATALAATSRTTGPLTATTPLPAAALTAESHTDAALAATIPLPASAVAGTVQGVAELAATNPVPTATLDAATTGTGTLDAAAPLPASALTGTILGVGELTATTPLPAAALTGTAAGAGALAATGVLPVAALQAEQFTTATLAATTPPPTATAAATTTAPAELAAAAPLPTAAAAGTVTTTGQMDALAPIPAAALTAPAPGTSSAFMQAESGLPTAALTVAAATTGPLATTAPSPTAAFAGTSTTTGTLTGAPPPPTAAIAGSGAVEAELAGVAPIPTASVGGSGAVEGTLAAATPSPTVQVAGSSTVLGVVTATLTAPTATATGQLRVTAAVAAVAPTPTGGLAAQLRTTGVLAATIPLPLGAVTTERPAGWPPVVSGPFSAPVFGVPEVHTDPLFAISEVGSDPTVSVSMT